MFGAKEKISSLLGAYHMAEVSMRYSQFVPRVYNLVKSFGFEPGRIMPSRAFCSDESQGYPVILLAKHFGAFPFNHGLGGGIVATDRHGPHAHHGKDLFIVQASHVGYDPDTQGFGIYRRLQTEGAIETSNCGKICGALEWYLQNYKFARDNIYIGQEDGKTKIIVDNSLLHSERTDGLILRLEKIVTVDVAGNPVPESSRSTAKVYSASPELLTYLKDFKFSKGQYQAIGHHLHPDLFYFRRSVSHEHEGRDHLERNLLEVMSYVVASPWPALTAAQANTQVEFDRAFRTIIQEPAYKNKNVFFISGLNVDISPQSGQLFPLTKFIPWAACLRDEKGNHQTWEQAEIYEMLKGQSTENPDEVNLEEVIEIMEKAKEIRLPF